MRGKNEGVWEESDEERTDKSRTAARLMLKGEYRVGTKTCHGCGTPVYVKKNALLWRITESGVREPGGVVASLAICHNGACRRITAQRSHNFKQGVWRYGEAPVVFVPGSPYGKVQLPISLSPNERAELEEFLRKK